MRPCFPHPGPSFSASPFDPREPSRAGRAVLLRKSRLPSAPPHGVVLSLIHHSSLRIWTRSWFAACAPQDNTVKLSHPRRVTKSHSDKSRRTGGFGSALAFGSGRGHSSPEYRLCGNRGRARVLAAAGIPDGEVEFYMKGGAVHLAGKRGRSLMTDSKRIHLISGVSRSSCSFESGAARSQTVTQSGQIRFTGICAFSAQASSNRVHSEAYAS